MITKAIIKEISTLEDNHFTVYIPLLRKANAPESSATLDATLVCIPGVDNAYTVGDVVYVDFEENQNNKPVIIGKLYLGRSDPDSINTTMTLKSLEVKEISALSSNTAVNGLNILDLYTKINWLMKNDFLPATISEKGEAAAPAESITYKNSIHNVSTVAQALNYLFSETPAQSAAKSLKLNIYNKAGVRMLRIYLNNFSSDDIGNQIWLYRKAPKYSGRTLGYAHPGDPDRLLSDIDPIGYGRIKRANKPLRGTQASLIPSLTYSFMPHNGYLKTEWTISAADITNGYVEINLSNELLSLLVPYTLETLTASRDATVNDKLRMIGKTQWFKYAYVINSKPVLFSDATIKLTRNSTGALPSNISETSIIQLCNIKLS